MDEKKENDNKFNLSNMSSEKDEKNNLYLSFNDCIEKEKEFKKNIQKRPKTFENIIKNNKYEYKIGGYLIENNLGEGTFGKVKLGIYIKNGEKVAIKFINKKKLKDKNDQIHLKREIDLLQKLNHINIASVSEIFENKDNYFIVMEYCSRGELFNYIVTKRRLNEAEAAYFFYQLINGLEYIHSIGISHRDIKPENLLLTSDYVLKIIDFGLSNYYEENINKFLKTPCGSPCYSSPEMVSGKPYDGFKVDIWSCGIVLFAMLCGYLPFDDKNDDKIIFKKIVECDIKYPFFLSDMSRDMITKLLIKDPNKRISIKQIKMHPFYLKGKQKYELDFGIINKSKNISTLTERSFFKSINNKKKENENEKNENKENENKNKRNKDLQNIKIFSNYSIDDENNDIDNIQKKLCYIPIETDVQEYRKKEQNIQKIKINQIKRDSKTEHGIKNKTNYRKYIVKKSDNKSNNIFDKKGENKSKDMININKLLRKNIISILFNQKKKNNKKKDIKLNINDNKTSINVSNIKSSFINNFKMSNIVNNNRSNNNIMYYMSSAENLFKKPHSKVKEKVSKLTKNFDINILNIEYLNTDINEVEKKKQLLKKKDYLRKFIMKPKSSNREECKNNTSNKNHLLIETHFSNMELSKKEKNLSNINSIQNTNNNYYLFKDDSINKENNNKNQKDSKIKIIQKEGNNYTNKYSNNILNNKRLKEINKKKVSNINKLFNFLSKENDSNINNNLITSSQSLNKKIKNKNVYSNRPENETYKKKHEINNTLLNLNENFNSNDLNIFNQKSKNKRNHNIIDKNNKENHINIEKIKKSISKKNKLIGLTKKKSFFTIRDTVINFESGNGKIIILPSLNKSKEKQNKKENNMNKKSKSLQGLQKSCANINSNSNYLINKFKNQKTSSSLKTNYKLNDLSSKTSNINLNNNISKDLSFNKDNNILYNYNSYKNKKDKSALFKKFEEKKSSGAIFLPQKMQNSQEKNYSKYNRIKIEEYYRNNMNINYGNNHKSNKINLINNKNKKKLCITNLYMNNNFKIDITGNFNSHKQTKTNIIKTNINSSKNDFSWNKNNNSNNSNNMIHINDKNIYRRKADSFCSYKSTHKKMLNLTHRTDNSIQKVIKNIITKI